MMNKFLCLLAIGLSMLLSSCSNEEAAVSEIEYPMGNTVWIPEEQNFEEMIYFTENIITYSIYAKDGEKMEGDGGRSCKYTYSHPIIQLRAFEGVLGSGEYFKAGEFLKGIETITVDSSKLTIKMFSGEVRVFVPKYKR